MQTSYSSSRILLPVRPWFIGFTLLTALLLNFLPTSVWPAVPDWLALLTVFWSVREPRLVGMGLAFVFGLVMDVADASLLGQHALAYVLAAYGGAALSRRILWFPLGLQALQVLPLLFLVQLVQFSVRLLAGADSIRDVIAFPKVQNAGEPMSGAPDIVDPQQLKDLSIALTLTE